MTVDYRPPLTREQLREAAQDGRLVTAEGAVPHGIPKATVNDWAAKGLIAPALDSRPRLYLTDDLYDLRRELAQQTPTRDSSGKFVRGITPE